MCNTNFENLLNQLKKGIWTSCTHDWTCIDDVTGTVVVKSKAIKARIKEMQFFRSRGMYTKVRRESHMKIIKTKWLHIKKGDNEPRNLRSRFVGCEFAKDKRDDLFAVTPPLESLRMIVALLRLQSELR